MNRRDQINELTARKLDAVRVALGKEQRELAADFGVSKGKMSETMRGISAVTSEMLWVLKTTYDVNLNWLFSESDEGGMFLGSSSSSPEIHEPAAGYQVDPRQELARALDAMQRAMQSLEGSGEGIKQEEVASGS
jgi:transcriptional regulator with XRE-family HTH domain